MLAGEVELALGSQPIRAAVPTMANPATATAATMIAGWVRELPAAPEGFVLMRTS
jgi:hypothetical protein